MPPPASRLKLPKGASGRDYVLISLKVGGQAFDFMVDSGLTAELITPRLRQQLGIPASKQTLAAGLGAGGVISGAELVQLKGTDAGGALCVHYECRQAYAHWDLLACPECL